MTRTRRSDCRQAGPDARGAAAGASRYLDERTGRPPAPSDRVRIAGLAIPPAWQDVWICPTRGGHIQAPGSMPRAASSTSTTRRWRARRDQAKFDEMLGSPARCRGCAAGSTGDLTSDGLRARARARLRGAAARPRLLPDRRRGLRGARTRPTAWRRCAGARQRARAGRRRVRLPGQARAAARAARRRSGLRARSSRRSGAGAGRRRAARVQGGPRAGATCAPTTSTTTSRRARASTPRRRTSGPGTRRCWRRCRSPCRRAPRDAKAARKRAIRWAVEQVAHYLGNTPAVARSVLHRPARLRPVPRRRDDRALARDARRGRRLGDPGPRSSAPCCG